MKGSTHSASKGKPGKPLDKRMRAQRILKELDACVAKGSKAERSGKKKDWKKAYQCAWNFRKRLVFLAEVGQCSLQFLPLWAGISNGDWITAVVAGVTIIFMTVTLICHRE